MWWSTYVVNSFCKKINILGHIIANTGWVDSYNVICIHFEVDDHSIVLVAMVYDGIVSGNDL